MFLFKLLFIALVAVVFIQVIYYCFFIQYFSHQKEISKSSRSLPLSVIICAKNEAENLQQNLPLIFEQKYANFEVVLINDASTDDTLEVFKAFKAKYDFITIVDVKTNEAFWGNKKYALTLGIKASKHDFLVFTDADCQPTSPLWLSHISRNFSNQKSIVLGYGGYFKKPKSLLNKLIRFETVLTALQYISFSNLGIPYMGVGRNMAYRKELFFNNAGFKNHMTLPSGDDDLFINEVATRSNTAICLEKDSFTLSIPKTTFKQWILQKRRHISTAKYYLIKHKIVLGTFYISQLMFWVLSMILLISWYQWKIVLPLITLRFLVQMISFGRSAQKLNESDLIIYSPFLELFLVIFQLFIFSQNLISKPKYWK